MTASERIRQARQRTQTTSEMRKGERVYITYRCRDIGYGVEEGEGDYVYAGRETLGGKLTFEEPISYVLEGGPRTIYLFDDEILSVEREEC